MHYSAIYNHMFRPCKYCIGRAHNWILFATRLQYTPQCTLQRHVHSSLGHTRQAMYVLLNTEARSYNHCCSEKAMSITYSECVFVALGIQHIMHNIAIFGLPRSTLFLHITSLTRGRDSSIGIVTRYGLEGPGIESRCGRDFPHLSRPALGPTQPPVQWVPGLSRG
jgi:hypothetical protein